MFLAKQAVENERCCFLSTPSIYYVIDNPDHQKPIHLFDVITFIIAARLKFCQE